MSHDAFTLDLPGGGTLALGRRALVMGILNVTPDSFSDGGDFAPVDVAVTHARAMADLGADILDVGAESTRPDAEPVAAQDELDRLMPVLDALAAANYPLPISVDTYKAVVAHQALQAGATIVNDVHGFRREPEIAGVAADAGAPAIAMHWDAERDRSRDVVGEVIAWFEASLRVAEQQGLPRERIILDPGFGFAKSLNDNYTLLSRLDELRALGQPLLIGTSRKSMIGKVLGNEPKQRLAGTLATTVLAYGKGGHIFRVHDVAENRDALRIAEAAHYGPSQEVI